MSPNVRQWYSKKKGEKQEKGEKKEKDSTKVTPCFSTQKLNELASFKIL